MAEMTLIVHHKVGLHARPAALFVQTATRFASDIAVMHGDKSGNAKSILSVLALGVNQDAQITISAEGADADAALVALKDLVDSNFGE